MKSIADSDAKKKWDKENTIFIGIKLNKHTDADIIALLEKQSSKAGYIKKILHEHAQKQK